MNKELKLPGPLTAEDIVSAGIVVGVRVEHVVELVGGEPVRLAIIAAGGQREDNTEVYVGHDSDGVEWRLAVGPGVGMSVALSATPGAQPTEQARFAKYEDARTYAAHRRARRPDLRVDDVVIGLHREP